MWESSFGTATQYPSKSPRRDQTFLPGGGDLPPVYPVPCGHVLHAIFVAVAEIVQQAIPGAFFVVFNNLRLLVESEWARRRGGRQVYKKRVLQCRASRESMSEGCERQC